jgi:pyruvate dehydrogenase E2 component (dihydrolipoamide acetyltransferase)
LATEVTIPNLGYTMTVAKILKWLKSVGDPVQAGEVLLEIETDKVNYGIESPAGGVVKLILVQPGDEVPVGGLVAVVGTADEIVDARHYAKKEAEKPIREAVQPARPKEAASPGSPPAEERRFVSPLARRMAREKGIDLSLVTGSGSGGRVKMADVEKYLGGTREKKIEGPLPPPQAPEIAEVLPLTTMRRRIAQRLVQSFHEAPHFNLCTEVDMTEVKRALAVLDEKGGPDEGAKISINDIFIKAVALTLRGHRRLNSRLNGDRIEIMRRINVGLAVALEDGLIVPAIEKADEKRLGQIARERKDLTERARQGRLALGEIERGTFTVSNLGMYDIVFFTSILNPPQSGILSIGKTMDRPVVRDGAVVIRAILEMSLAVDHRIVDGAMGARFLQDLKLGLENPVLLM